MKKAVLLFALPFVLVAFLNAQNDCTGSSYNDSPQLKSKKPINYNDANLISFTDCTKPGKKNDLYSLDQFEELMNNTQNWFLIANSKSTSSVVSNSKLRSKANYSQNFRNAFSESDTEVCCVPPPPGDYQDNSIKFD